MGSMEPRSLLTLAKQSNMIHGIIMEVELAGVVLLLI